ncbi:MULTISPECIES: hypothetical protein [unclassified Bradyrhizobium]|uniref:hypothetical protein n=1 Tax=unclassified Bradyrhizobium TaxID=2631580 RepID=UPI003399AAF5
MSLATVAGSAAFFVGAAIKVKSVPFAASAAMAKKSLVISGSLTIRAPASPV